MARFHINPETGNTGMCRAQQSCPFGGAEDHYATPEAAREAFEAKQGGSFASPALFDPRDETEFVIESVKAENLRDGDEYEGEEVLSKKVGRKWVTLTTPTRKEILVPVGEKVAVQRERPTAAARAAENAHQKERMAKQSVTQAKERLEKAVTDVTESIQKYGHADSFKMAALISAQETNGIWSSVGRMAEDKGITYQEAIEIKVNQLTEGITGYGFRSGLSRSTSVVSNVMEDAKNEAMIEFLRSHKDGWY